MGQSVWVGVDVRALAEAAAMHRERGFEHEVSRETALLREHRHALAEVLLRLVDEGDVDLALRAAGGLSVFWQDEGLVSEGRAATTSLLAAVGEPPGASYARTALVAGELAFRQGDQGDAAHWSEIARRCASDAGDPWTVGRAEINLARIAFRDGEADRTDAHAEAALANAPDDPLLEAAAHHMRGWAVYTSGDVAAAIDVIEENARRYQRLGDQLCEASELANVAELAMEVGDVHRAGPLLARALELPAAAQSAYLGPSLVQAAGVFAALTGRPEAPALLAAADDLHRRFDLTPDPGDELTGVARERVGQQSIAAAAPTVVGQELTEVVRLARRAVVRTTPDS